MDDADQGMEASAATIRDRVRRQNAVTLKHQQAIYTEKLRPSIFFFSLSPHLLVSLSLFPASHSQLIISHFAVLVFNSVRAGRSLEEGLHPLGKRLSSE